MPGLERVRVLCNFLHVLQLLLTDPLSSPYPPLVLPSLLPVDAAGGGPGWSWTTARRRHQGPRPGPHAPNLRRATGRCGWVGKQVAMIEAQQRWAKISPIGNAVVWLGCHGVLATAPLAPVITGLFKVQNMQYVLPR